jgi:coenzyme PQQ precursor peptide PqqA
VNYTVKTDTEVAKECVAGRAYMTETVGVGGGPHGHALSFGTTEWLNIIMIFVSCAGSCEMEWTTPDFIEIELNCEINSYANAEL